MDMTVDQQVALDEALVPHASRLRIRRSNFRLQLNISSKESTLQLVYDVLRLTPFFKAFLVTADVPEIYMQEFWATATVHHHSIRFKMDNKKHIVNLEYFKEMLHICPRLPAIINKCLSEKSSGYDSLRLSQAQILWGFYHKRNVDFAYLMWEDFVYQVEHKDTNKSNEMYYPRFTKMIIHYFMSKDPSIPRRNKVNWHYVRDDQMFTTIKLNSEAYKEYYAVAIGATPPKTKASVRKTKSSSNTIVTLPLTAAAGTRLFTSAKGKQLAKASKAKSLTALSEGFSMYPLKSQIKIFLRNLVMKEMMVMMMKKEVMIKMMMMIRIMKIKMMMIKKKGMMMIIKRKVIMMIKTLMKKVKNLSIPGNGEENLRLNVSREEGQDEEDDEDKLYRDVNINLEGMGVQMPNVHTTQEFEDSHVTLTPINPDGQQQSSSVSSQFVTSMLNPTSDAGIEFIFETTSQMDVQAPTSVAPLPLSPPTLTPSTIATITTVQQAPTPPTTASSTLLQNLPNFGSLFGFDHRLKTLEDNFSKFVQTNQFSGAVSSIPGIVQRYMDQQMNEAVKNIQKIIKEQVKEQVKVKVSKILSRIEQTVNEQLEAEVLTRSSNSSKTSYAIAADLLEMELKKILIKKMEGNKSIHRSIEQRNLYKVLVEAYESDKIILDTYGDTVTLKRRHDDDADKDEEPSAGSDRGSADKSTQGSKSQQTSTSESATAEEPMQTTHEIKDPLHPEFETCAYDQPIAEPSQHPEWFSQQKKPPTPDRDWNKTLPDTHRSIQPWISELAKQTDSRSSFNELMDTPVDFLDFLMNQLKVDTLTPKLLAGPTYELMKGSCKSLVELEFFLEEVYKATMNQLVWINPEGQQYPHNLLKPLPLIPNSQGRRIILFDHFINNDLEYLCGGALSRKYTTSVTKTKAAAYGHIKWIEDLFYGFAVNRESARDVYSKRKIITATKLKIVEWHNYKHLDWITVRRDDDKLYKFKEGVFKRLCIQDIKDMLLLLVQGKLTNLTKKLNLTRLDTYRSDLKRKEDYIAYSNPRGFIYQNKDKQNRLMRIDELQKFSDGTLTVGIWMKYLPQTIWRKSDKERAATMIQAIDKQLKTRRIMRSLESGRLYEGDFRMLQRTI
uniref:Uncharacterized protein n=1 Tax=Tanacetum cinerariifolium TaxID=118510 RepID=A0A6L2JES5_TANCI|nr:hypothetical protein [Tanacetum cinerariifolium]